MGRYKCPGLLKSFLSYGSSSLGQILLYWSHSNYLFTTRDGKCGRWPPLTSPRSSVLTREEVVDGFQIAGFVSPGLRNLHLEKPCLLVEQKYSISHESESEMLLSHVPLCDPMGCSPWNSPGQNTGVGNLSLLQRIVPTQG